MSTRRADMTTSTSASRCRPTRSATGRARAAVSPAGKRAVRLGDSPLLGHDRVLIRRTRSRVGPPHHRAATCRASWRPSRPSWRPGHWRSSPLAPWACPCREEPRRCPASSRTVPVTFPSAPLSPPTGPPRCLHPTVGVVPGVAVGVTHTETGVDRDRGWVRGPGSTIEAAGGRDDGGSTGATAGRAEIRAPRRHAGRPAGRGPRLPRMRSLPATPPRPCSRAARSTPRWCFVGEQPGDVEDRRGEPFVGPAGRLLARAARRDRPGARPDYVTNAVKHFKFRPDRAGQAADPPESRPARGGGLPALADRGVRRSSGRAWWWPSARRPPRRSRARRSG